MPAEVPYATVVVPTRDRPTSLRRCLDALAELDYPRERYEVVVVDDGGVLPARPPVDEIAGRLRVQLVTQPPSGPAIARNRGAAAGGGELLAFTDDDCRPLPGWLAALARTVTLERAVGGATVNELPGNPFAEASQSLIGHLYEYYGAEAGRPTFLASNNLAVDAEAFRAIGGFDERLPRAAAEDREFCDRWLASGRRLGFAPDALVRHAHDLNLRTFARQHFNYGRGALYYHRARARRGGGALRVEPPRFYIQLLRRPLRESPGARGVVGAALLGVAQVVNAAGFAWELAVDAAAARFARARP